MAAIYVLLLWSLVLSCHIICGCIFVAAVQDDSEDAADWLDPTDMINYDLATRRMSNSQVCEPDRSMADRPPYMKCVAVGRITYAARSDFATLFSEHFWLVSDLLDSDLTISKHFVDCYSQIFTDQVPYLTWYQQRQSTGKMRKVWDNNMIDW